MLLSERNGDSIPRKENNANKINLFYTVKYSNAILIL